MKWCPRCSQWLSTDVFHKSSRHKDGLRAWCKPCCNEDSRNYRKKYPERVAAQRAAFLRANPDYMKKYDTDRIEKRKQRQQRLLAKHKHGRPCHDCGVVFHHFVMDFDHRPGEVKSRDISWMIKNNANEQEIEREIAKCDLVCANCHRIRTGRRLGVIPG